MSNIKENVISFRLTTTDKEKIKELATEQRLTMSAYLINQISSKLN